MTVTKRLAHPTRAALLGGLLAILSACAGETADAGEETTLAGSQWVATAIGGQTVLEEPLSTLHFESHERVVGNAGCNHYFGGYSLDGTKIASGPFGATQMYCSEEVNDQERRFLDAMSQSRRYTFDGPNLIFHGDDGQIQVRFAPQS